MTKESTQLPRETKGSNGVARSREGLKVTSPVNAEDELIVSAAMDCAFTVHRALGPGYRERIYERALCLELDSRGISFECEKPIEVKYREWTIPGHKIDLLIEQKVLVELKAVPKLSALHRDQVISYLKALDLRIGLLVNFNVSLLKHGFRRVIR